MTRDRLQRPLRSLRVSVTDRCNLRCRYCMPEEHYEWLPREQLLTYEEIVRVVGAFTVHGVSRIRLTGGEPLLRKDLSELIVRLSRVEGLDDLALTTNGVLLQRDAAALRAAGLERVTISLDSLDPERFARLSARRALDDVLAGIEAARTAGFTALKLNTVVLRGENDEEIPALLEFASSIGAELRFIEYMDVGGATKWSGGEVVSQTEILARIEARFGTATAVPGRGAAPAARWRLPDGTLFGIIASTTAPFCGACDRSRLTADGTWYLCLYAREGIDLRAPLRAGASVEELAAEIGSVWSGREARGAEDRLAMEMRGAFVGRSELLTDPRLEMHTRGG